jgi:hypothetical protein
MSVAADDAPQRLFSLMKQLTAESAPQRIAYHRRTVAVKRARCAAMHADAARRASAVVACDVSCVPARYPLAVHFEVIRDDDGSGGWSLGHQRQWHRELRRRRREHEKALPPPPRGAAAADALPLLRERGVNRSGSASRADLEHERYTAAANLAKTLAVLNATTATLPEHGVGDRSHLPWNRDRGPMLAQAVDAAAAEVENRRGAAGLYPRATIVVLVECMRRDAEYILPALLLWYADADAVDDAPEVYAAFYDDTEAEPSAVVNVGELHRSAPLLSEDHVAPLHFDDGGDGGVQSLRALRSSTLALLLIATSRQRMLEDCWPCTLTAAWSYACAERRAAVQLGTAHGLDVDAALAVVRRAIPDAPASYAAIADGIDVRVRSLFQQLTASSPNVAFSAELVQSNYLHAVASSAHGDDDDDAQWTWTQAHALYAQLTGAVRTFGERLTWTSASERRAQQSTRRLWWQWMASSRRFGLAHAPAPLESQMLQRFDGDGGVDDFVDNHFACYGMDGRGVVSLWLQLRSALRPHDVALWRELSGGGAPPAPVLRGSPVDDKPRSVPAYASTHFAGAADPSVVDACELLQALHASTNNGVTLAELAEALFARHDETRVGTFAFPEDSSDEQRRDNALLVETLRVLTDDVIAVSKGAGTAAALAVDFAVALLCFLMRARAGGLWMTMPYDDADDAVVASSVIIGEPRAGVAERFADSDDADASRQQFRVALRSAGSNGALVAVLERTRWTGDAERDTSVASAWARWHHALRAEYPEQARRAVLPDDDASRRQRAAALRELHRAAEFAVTQDAYDALDGAYTRAHGWRRTKPTRAADGGRAAMPVHVDFCAQFYAAEEQTPQRTHALLRAARAYAETLAVLASAGKTVVGEARRCTDAGVVDGCDVWLFEQDDDDDDAPYELGSIYGDDGVVLPLHGAVRIVRRRSDGAACGLAFAKQKHDATIDVDRFIAAWRSRQRRELPLVSPTMSARYDTRIAAVRAALASEAAAAASDCFWLPRTLSWVPSARECAERAARWLYERCDDASTQPLLRRLPNDDDPDGNAWYRFIDAPSRVVADVQWRGWARLLSGRIAQAPAQPDDAYISKTRTARFRRDVDALAETTVRSSREITAIDDAIVRAATVAARLAVERCSVYVASAARPGDTSDEPWFIRWHRAYVLHQWLVDGDALQPPPPSAPFRVDDACAGAFERTYWAMASARDPAPVAFAWTFYESERDAWVREIGAPLAGRRDARRILDAALVAAAARYARKGLLYTLGAAGERRPATK